MFVIKYAFSYALCLYYLFLTPKAMDYKLELEGYLFYAVFSSIAHAFGVFYLFHYLGWMEPLINGFHSLTGYYAGQGIEIAGLFGAWNLLGALQYPYLNESIIEDENKTDPQKEKQAIIAKATAEYRQQAERRWRDLVTQKGVANALAYLKDSQARQARGLDHESFARTYDHSEVMRDPKWIKAEIKRLENLLKNAPPNTAKKRPTQQAPAKPAPQAEEPQIETKFW